MPLLQVRGCPEDLYKKVAQVAKRQNRTIAQQVVVLLEKGLLNGIRPLPIQIKISMPFRGMERWLGILEQNKKRPIHRVRKGINHERRGMP